MGGREALCVCGCPKSVHDTGWDAAGCMASGCICRSYCEQRGGYFTCERPGQVHGKNCHCVASAERTGMSSTAESASTTSAKDTDDGGPTKESGSEVPPPSKSGSGRTRGRRTAKGTTPPTPDPPDLSAEAGDLLADKAKLADRLKRDLMEHYLIEAEFGKRKDVNPQHSRASRKQAKELAELIWRLNAEANK